jgi:hypothetical protein
VQSFDFWRSRNQPGGIRGSNTLCTLGNYSAHNKAAPEIDEEVEIEKFSRRCCGQFRCIPRPDLVRPGLKEMRYRVVATGPLAASLLRFAVRIADATKRFH